jgi:hypothetical protein
LTALGGPVKTISTRPERGSQEEDDVSYSDMDGLAMWDDGMGGWMSADMLKMQLMAGVAGGGGILLTSAVVQKLGDYLPADWTDVTKSRVKSAMAIGIGVLGGRFIWDRSRDASMGFVGGVVGSALAQLVAGMSNGTLTTSLSGGLSDMDLASLEAAVTTTTPAYSRGAIEGTAVTERALSAPGVTNEVLAEYAAYLS